MFRVFIAALAIATLAGPPALAQDVGRNPSFGTLNLKANFPDDPRWVNVRAGGTRDARSVSTCEGSIADAPDLRVNYSAAPGFALTFFVRSNADTILVINDPNGEWHCDDDSGGNFDPMFKFTTPLSGQYDIWIGHYDGGRQIPAQLGVTER